MVSIAWLKVNTTPAEGEAPVAPVAGTVETMVGDCACACKRPQNEATMAKKETPRRRSAKWERRFIIMGVFKRKLVHLHENPRLMSTLRKMAKNFP